METLTVTGASDMGNLCVLLQFSDNSSQVVDVGEFIRRHPDPQYNKYLDPKKFAKFKIEHGNIVWGSSWDLIFPVEQLHEGCIL